MLVIIAGFHRSGTSLLAQLMHRAGLFLGEDLLGASRHNPYGFFEDREVVEIHDQILAAHGRTWQSDTASIPYIHPDLWRRMEHLVARRAQLGTPWGFKDPRVCLFVPLWRHLVPDTRLVATYRDPAATALSLERRHAQNLLSGGGGGPENHWPFFTRPDHALSLWLTHNRALIRAVRAFGPDAVMTSFRALEANHDIIGVVNDRFGLDLDPLPPAAVYDPTVVSATEPRYFSSDRALRHRIEQVWDTLVSLESHGARP